MFHQKTKNAAKGQWRGILMHLGVPGEALADKHGPCPVCGGKDRFRFDNKDGNGTFICSNCGAGDGLKLAMLFTGQQFIDVAPRIDKILGNEKFERDQPKIELTPEKIQWLLREVAARTAKVKPGDVVDRYLHGRGIGDTIYPKAIRTAQELKDGQGGIRPAMVVTIRDRDGVNVTLHRTFLKPDGSGKAEMQEPRKIMPGTLPDGAAARLSDQYSGGALGVAEGIETALAAARLFEMPVWAAINTSMMKRWLPPDGCTEVTIFADNDAKFGGHAAAYVLAHKLAVRGVDVDVKVPDQVGWDWNDVLLAKLARG